MGSMGGKELAVMMPLGLWLSTLGEGAQVLAAEVAVAAEACCASSHRLFGITQHSCSFGIYLHQASRQIAHTSKMYPQIIAHGRSPIGQRIFQEDVEILY